MMGSLPTITLWALLLLPLVLSPVLGLLTPYVALLVIIPLFVVTIVRRQFAAAYASYEARAFLAAFVLLAVLFAITADSVSDALRAFNFTMLLAYGAIALFLRRRAATVTAERVAQLAGLGVLFGFIEVVASALLRASERPTAVNLGPIVLSNGLLALGFIALGGVLLRRDRFGWLYCLAPVLAIAATLITGSRGPLIAVPFAAAAAAIFVWRERFGQSARAALLGIGALVLLAVAGAAIVLQGRASTLLGIVGTLLGGGMVADESTRERLVFYSVGWRSFLQSPWIGHGWANIMDSVRPMFAVSDASLAIYPQLHNDLINFAVGAGVIGVLCYLVIITAPLIGAWFSPRDSLRTFRLYGATVLTIVYIGGGLTDLMFGFEFHTFLFIMLTAILLGFCRDKAAA
jgi:O-antigen ligase